MTFGPQKKNDDQKTEFDCFFYTHRYIYTHPPVKRDTHRETSIFLNKYTHKNKSNNNEFKIGDFF